MRLAPEDFLNVLSETRGALSNLGAVPERRCREHRAFRRSCGIAPIAPERATSKGYFPALTTSANKAGWQRAGVGRPPLPADVDLTLLPGFPLCRRASRRPCPCSYPCPCPRSCAHRRRPSLWRPPFGSRLSWRRLFEPQPYGHRSNLAAFGACAFAAVAFLAGAFRGWGLWGWRLPGRRRAPGPGPAAHPAGRLAALTQIEVHVARGV